MISVLLTALIVQGLTRRYACLQASLFAALCFLFAPLLLQKLAIAEPDTWITLLSFAAFLNVVERHCRGRRVNSALDCLWIAACSARHGQGPAAGGIFRLGHGGLSDG
jgi:hypothetical protein